MSDQAVGSMPRRSLPAARVLASGRGLSAVIITVAAAVAFALSLYQLTRPGLLFGLTEYDDGVYFGSAVRLIHGAIPYRDFVLVQPPGFVVLASPVALLSQLTGTRDALAVARLFMPVVAALNVVLVGRIVRHRGALATLVAAGLMAVFPAEINATHTLLLEPLLDLFCLLGVAIVFRGETLGDGRRLLLGGIALGFAGAIKGWALIPVLIICVLCLPQVRRRLGPFAGGVAIGFGVPTLPFLLLAPGAFFHEVLFTQLNRIHGTGRVPLTTRLGDLTGAASYMHGGNATRLAIALALLAVVLAVSVLVLSRRRPTRFEVFAIASMAGVGLLLLAPAEFYGHYAAFFAPFVAMVVGIAVGQRVPRAAQGVALVLALAGLAWLTDNQVQIVGRAHALDRLAEIDSVIPPGGCALADSPADLITVNRFVSPVPGCAANVADPYGTTISGGNRTPATYRFWDGAIARSDYVVLRTLRNGNIPLSTSARAALADQFTLASSSGLLIYVRHGYPVG